MFGNTIAGELKRRLYNLRENFKSQQSLNTSQHSYVSNASSPSRGPTRSEAPSTSDVIQQHIHNTASKVDYSSSVKDDVLSGKIKSTSRRDLLELENISLQTLIGLLEGENAQLHSLCNTVVASGGDDDDGLEVIRTQVHPSMRQIHDELLAQRRQSAVDLVESIFRCLHTRPPPRVRGDSIRTRSGTRASAQSVSRTSPFPSRSRIGASCANEISITLSEPIIRRSAGGSGSDSGGSGPRMVHGGSMSYNPYSIGTDHDSVDNISEDVVPVVVGGRRGSVSASTPVYVYSVFKVNKFRKNSPHILEIDVRTRSLSIKDANGVTKVELGEHDLLSTRVDRRDPKVVTIVYKMVLKESAGDQTVVMQKKYKFSSMKQCEEFRDTISHCVRQGSNRQPSVSAMAQFRAMLQQDVPSGLDPLKPRAAPTNIEVAPPAPYLPMPKDVSHVSLRDDLQDAIDAVAENLARLWNANHSKENYQVKDKYGEVSLRVRLKNQLRSFMGANNQSAHWQSLATLMAADLVRIVYSGYSIQLEGERQSVQQLLMTPDMQELIRVLAVESNERWCFLAQRSNLVREDRLQSSSVSGTSTDLRIELMAERDDFAVVDLPPPPILEEEEDAPPPPPGGTMSDNDEPVPPPPDDNDNVPPPPPEEEEESSPPKIERQTTLTVNLEQDSQYPVVVLRRFDDLPKEQQLYHIADATEVLRTLFEYQYVVVKR